MSSWGPWASLLKQLTIPQDAGPGDPRIVIGSTLPPPLDTYLVFGTQPFIATIVLYSGTPTDDDYIFFGLVRFPTAVYLKIGAVLNGAVLESGPGFPWSLGLNFDGSGTVSIDASAHTVAGQNSAWSVLKAVDPATGNTQESWHAFTFQNAWINDPGAFQSTLMYRRTVLNTVQINGIVRSPNPFNAIMGNLPASYRPITPQPIWAWTGAAVNTIIRIDTNGDVNALGNTTVLTTWWIQAEFPLDK